MKRHGRICCTTLVLGLLAAGSLRGYAADKPAKDDKRADRNYTAEIEAEVAEQTITLPPQMDLEMEWHARPVKAEKAQKAQKGCKVINAWVKEDLVLLETEKHDLIAMRRADGVELWVCHLSQSPRYAPAVSRNNVVLNLNNDLQAINRATGELRWLLHVSFVMSCEPLVIDPPVYPAQYTRAGNNLESIYVGDWNGKLQCLTVRGRIRVVAEATPRAEAVRMPEFELDENWHKALKNAGSVTAAPVFKENLIYYSGDDHYLYCVNREGDEREPYPMLGAPSTNLVVNAVSCFTGATDNYLYCIDRLTLRKKWGCACGQRPSGDIYADELSTPYVYFTTSDCVYHALKVLPARAVGHGQPETPETYAPAWELKNGAGTLTAGPDIVYVGSEPVKDKPLYQRITAVNKATGKVLWSCAGGQFAQFLQFHNAWVDPAQAARIYAFTSDNRLVSLRERSDKPQPVTAKSSDDETTTIVVPAKKKAAEGDAAPDAKAPEAKAPDAAAPAKAPDAPAPAKAAE